MNIKSLLILLALLGVVAFALHLDLKTTVLLGILLVVAYTMLRITAAITKIIFFIIVAVVLYILIFRMKVLPFKLP